MTLIEELEARLARIEDRQAIVDLDVRYCHASDDRDYDAVAAMFAADGRLDAPAGTVQGRDAVAEYLRGRLGHYGPTIHTSHTHLIEFADDEHASGVVSSHVEIARDGESTIQAQRYLDRYVKENGRWVFAERKLRFYYSLRWEDIGESLTGELRMRHSGRPPAPADLPESLPVYRAARAAERST